MFETLGGVASMGISLPMYAHYGLGDDYSVLYDASVREPIIRWTIIFSTLAALISAIPFLFCKMTNKRHEEIIAELKAREALAEGSQATDETQEAPVAEVVAEDINTEAKEEPKE